MHENDLIKFMSVNDSVEVHNDNGEGEGEAQRLSADLIRKGLQFATRMEQHFLSVDHVMELALKFHRNLQICIAGYQELFKQLEKP